MSPVFGFNTDIRYGDTVYHVQTEAHEAECTVQTAVFVRGRCVDKQQTSYAQEASQPGFSEGNVHQLLTHQHKSVVNTIREGRFGSLLNMRAQSPAPTASPVYPAQKLVARPPLPVPIPRPVENEKSITSAPANVAPLPKEDELPGIAPEPNWDQTPPGANPEIPVELPSEAAIDPVVPESLTPELRLEWLSSESVITAGTARVRYRLTLGSRAIEGAKIVARLEVGRIPSAYARSVTDCEGEAELSFKLPSCAQTAESLGFTAQVTHSGQSVTRRFSLNRKA